ncbi:DUF4198 domain-containing protein [Phenylobacterium sp. LjRoot225]|uniref:DUF4198 domain-containing protein n=1 Tax=Phenylobacterium sp. LjRoot225 TaxID=3342285 RepID=UPI003ECD27A9
MRLAGVFAGILGGLVLAQAAAAHTPYLKPTNFAPDRAFVTVEAAVGETFFVPDFPIRGAVDYWVTGPTGVPAKAEAVTSLKEFAAIEVSLPTEGTYRISTGDRLSRTTKWVKVDGAWKMVRAAGAGQARPAEPPRMGEAARPAGPSRFIEEAAVPPGAETVTSQSYSRVETYVSRGAPSREALKPTGQGLELEPVTHPNEIYAGEAFKFRLLLDGKPLPGAGFTVVRGGDAYAESRYAFAGKSDAAGAAAVTIAQPGMYLLEASYPARVEGPAEPVTRSSQFTLTFEVTR